ncbi:penicillin-insensitive murein endopeptidase [Gammaproteobacteria bacterium]|nr:penicillin-insensitive murein endopeptidase [Gammaproteobacteria bacterium]
MNININTKIKLKYFLTLANVLVFMSGYLYAAPNAWSAIKAPRDLPLNVYGSASNGCITGAQKLAPAGLGYQTMRQSRNRHYGHPNLIDFVKRMGNFSASQQHLLLLGDMSQAMGGPMSSDHASHQSGLDIDIWLYQTNPQEFKSANIETMKMRSVTDKAGMRLNKYWRDSYFELLKTAAQDPQVERIFLNPVIKRALCEQEPNGAWLQKIRPWWGHDSHFHVRLKCPKGQKDCKNQAALAQGTGCNKDLDNWIKDQSDAILYPKKVLKSTYPKAVKAPLPSACLQLVN